MHQHGFHVERRFGWDTHGLPVEFEIDKTLGIKGPQDVAKMGIAAYNAVSSFADVFFMLFNLKIVVFRYVQ
jgi:isoleucyl-tRNA synthetase